MLENVSVTHSMLQKYIQHSMYSQTDFLWPSSAHEKLSKYSNRHEKYLPSLDFNPMFETTTFHKI